MIGNTLFFSSMGLMSGLPRLQGLFSFGVEPDVYLNFAVGYSKVGGVISPVANQLTCVRASTRYVDDVSGNWALVGANLSGLSTKGLLVEEARTNSLRNNSMQGAVVGVIGSGGAAPTNWVVATAGTGLTSSIVAVGTVNGIDYIDIRFSGTTISSGTLSISFDNLSATAAQNQIWSIAHFLAMVAGSTNGIPSIRIDIEELPSGVSNNINITSLLNSTLTRYTTTQTLNQATTTGVQARLLFTANNAQAIDITVRIGWPQLELGAWATSPIRTTNAAVTRAADVVSLTTPPAFGNAYTIYGAAVPNAPATYTTFQTTLSLDDTTVNNRAQLARGAAGAASIAIVVSGGTTGLNLSVTPIQNTNILVKSALASAANDQQAAFNGGLASPTGTGPLPVSVNTFHLGCRADGTVLWNGYITEAAIWANQRLTNAQLQAGTT